MTIGAGQIGGFARTRQELKVPDIQFHHAPFSTSGLGKKLHDFPGFALMVYQLQPESRGHLTIRSADLIQTQWR